VSFQDNTELFLDEAQELLERAEKALLELEKHPENRDLVHEVFRALHTIKGSGAMFGFQAVSEFTHDVENLFDEVRKGKIAIDARIVDLGLRSVDGISRLLTNPQGEELHRQIKHDILHFGSLPAPSSDREWRIVFKPQPTALHRGVRLEPLFGELAALGTLKVTADVDGVPPLESLEPTTLHLSWTLQLFTKASLEDIRAVFMFVEDYVDLAIEPIGPAPVSAAAPPVFSTPAAVSAAEAPADRDAKHEASTIRVRRDKLDTLIDLVGELVILQAGLELEAKRSAAAVFETFSETLSRLTSDLRDTTMTLRMVPLEESFSSLHRLVRDLASQVGKELRLVVEVGDTELDKNVVEALKDPLIHIIRNTADHGIERPEVREQAGKARLGTITLSAHQVGSRVEISVADDGAGLNVERIKARAVERKLIDATETDVERIQAMIFEPGFSTAEKTTDLSGRGVGMDVVRSNVEKLRGEVRLHSVPGRGMTVTLSIPLTLVIIDGLLVTVGNADYVVSLAQVEECVDLTSDIRVNENSDEMIDLRGRTIPVISMRTAMDIAAPFPEPPRLVIFNNEGTAVALAVDAVVGRQQVVIKPLSNVMNRVRILSGATILGDGSVAFILDVNEVVKAHGAQMEKEMRLALGAAR
jgi:two-component system chemotaxis sensor kinase CheA